jgi:hypothetical protein
MAIVTCLQTPNRSAAVTGIKKALQKEVQRLTTLHRDSSEKRRQQLWRIAKHVDDVAREDMAMLGWTENPEREGATKTSATNDTPIEVSFHVDPEFDA